MQNRIIFVGAAVLLLAMAPLSTAEAATERSRSGVIWLAGGARVPGAFSVLMRNDDGVAMRLETSGLPRGTYTVWWIVWDEPGNCAEPFKCGEVDLGNFDAGFAAHFAAAAIKARSSASLALAGALSRGAATLVGDGFDNPLSAEIHWVVQYHGPVDPEQVHLQLQSPPGQGCNPDCLDLQGSIHRAP